MTDPGRTRLPFRAVNRKGLPGYDPGLQRHHLLPCQLLSLMLPAQRRRLLDDRRRLVLNRCDPLGQGYAFAALDAMAERLWAGTRAIAAERASFAA